MTKEILQPTILSVKRHETCPEGVIYLKSKASYNHIINLLNNEEVYTDEDMDSKKLIQALEVSRQSLKRSVIIIGLDYGLITAKRTTKTSTNHCLSELRNWKQKVLDGTITFAVGPGSHLTMRRVPRTNVSSQVIETKLNRD